MFLKFILLCCVFVFKSVSCLEEGELCSAPGGIGVCTTITKCPSAIEDIKNRKRPQICGFVGTTPIVCCIKNANVGPPADTTERVPTTTPSAPETPAPVDRQGDCEAIPEKTSKKTGQKAFDKCIDYQASYVYPCGRSVALTGGLTRLNNCHHNADKLIVGGNATAQYEFPHMVMLGYEETDDSTISWLCGGSIISDKYILTAGHCTYSKSVGEVKHVLVGAYTRNDANIQSNIYKVKTIIKHPEYKPPSKYNDIALLETEKPMKLSQFVVPACLDVGEAVSDDRVLATGWGNTLYKGSLAEVMQKVIVEKFTTDECSIKYPEHRHMAIGFDSETQTCYGDRKVAKDTCQGDSGGPLQLKSKKIHCMYILVGVTSFGRACGFPAEPAIYTKVSHYVPWIESIVWP